MYTISKYNSYFWFLITLVLVTSVEVANGEIGAAHTYMAYLIKGVHSRGVATSSLIGR